MKIWLENFRCHRKVFFEIPETGFISFEGANGAGKSTIFAAISFAFYGKSPSKKRRTNTSHGETSCRVKLEYERYFLTIDRTSTSTVSVEHSPPTGKKQKLAGAAASELIVSLLGMDYETFILSSYIYQGGSDVSVLSMTPSQQIEFVETIAHCKDRIARDTELIKKDNEKLKMEKTCLESNLELLKSQLADLPEDKEETESVESLTSLVSQQKDKLDAVSKKIKETRKSLDEARKKQKDASEKRDAIKKTKVEIEALEKQVPEKGLDPEELKTTLDAAREKLANYQAFEKFIKDSGQLEKANVEFSKTTDKKISALKKVIVSEKEIGEQETQLTRAENELYQYHQDLEKYEILSKKKEKAKALIAITFKKIRVLTLEHESFGSEYALEEKVTAPKKMVGALGMIVEKIQADIVSIKKETATVRCCPGCLTKLVLVDEQLFHAPKKSLGKKETAVVELAQLKNELLLLVTSLEKASVDFSIKLEKPTIEANREEEIKNLKTGLEKAKSDRRQLEDLERRELPIVLQKLEKSLADVESDFADFLAKSGLQDVLPQKIEKYATLVEDLLSKLALAKKSQADAEAVANRLIEKRKLLARQEKDVPSIDGTPEAIENLEKKLVSFSDDSVKLGEKISACKTSLAAAEAILQRTKLERNIEKTKRQIANVSDMIIGNRGLEEGKKEAQVISLQRTVESINLHAAYYLEKFFDTHISIRLVCVTEKKKGLSVQMSTEVFYNGTEHSDIYELSGAGAQKAALAFQMGLADMKKSKILILDESINSVKQPFHSQILEIIRDECNDKVIMVVSHEAVAGIFDTVVEVK